MKLIGAGTLRGAVRASLVIDLPLSTYINMENQIAFLGYYFVKQEMREWNTFRANVRRYWPYQPLCGKMTSF